jgi:hypothetical protein
VGVSLHKRVHRHKDRQTINQQASTTKTYTVTFGVTRPAAHADAAVACSCHKASWLGLQSTTSTRERRNQAEHISTAHPQVPPHSLTPLPTDSAAGWSSALARLDCTGADNRGRLQSCHRRRRTTIGEGSNMTQRPCVSACNDTRTRTSWPAKHPQHPATPPSDCRTPWKKPTNCTQILTSASAGWLQQRKGTNSYPVEQWKCKALSCSAHMQTD